VQSARSRLAAMHGVIKPLMRQMVQWLTTGKVAANKIIHVGIPPSASHRTQQSGQEDGVWLGLSDQSFGWGLCVWDVDCGQCRREADAAQGARRLPGDIWSGSDAGVGGLRPGRRFKPGRARGSLWRVSSRWGFNPKGIGLGRLPRQSGIKYAPNGARAEGVIGTLKSNRYKFNKPKERPMAHAGGWQARGSILSFNLNKFMRDLVEVDEVRNRDIGTGTGNPQRREKRVKEKKNRRPR